jgi:micrococcal nuclease
MNRKAIIPPFLILLVLFQSSGLQAKRPLRTLPAEVLSITDGDTIVVRLDGRKERVHLIGIDAPESSPNSKAQRDSLRTGDDLKTIIEMGQRSTRFFKTVLRVGDRVSIELDVQKRDRYGRLLGYIWLRDGRMLNEEIVRAGYAGLMIYPPNVKYWERIEKAYRDAREAKRGLLAGSRH